MLRIIILALLLASCTDKPPQTMEVTGESGVRYEVRCLNGVKYYAGQYILAPVYEYETKQVATCGEPEPRALCFKRLGDLMVQEDCRG